MSYHYFPAQAARLLLQSGFSDGERSVTSKYTHMRLRYFKPELRRGGLTTRLYGTTSERLTGNALEDWLMLSLPDSPASPTLSPESVGQTQTNATDGLIPYALLERSDPDTVFWKTSQDYLVPPAGVGRGTSARYSETWPKAGMMLDGACYRRRSWERTISESGSGLWPTPKGSHSGPDFARINRAKSGGDDLATAVARLEKWPTPAARDYRSPNKNDNMGDQLPNRVGGMLNPEWVEWLMGWPIGWTELKRLGTGRFQQWRHMFGIY